MPLDLIPLDADLLLAARELCADSGDTNPEYVRACAELIRDVTPGLVGVDGVKEVLIDFLGAPSVDPNGPMTDEQRSALFAGFRDVFGDDYSDEQRYAFTRLALGFDPADDFTHVSWARRGKGALTAGEASKVLNTLRVLNV